LARDRKRAKQRAQRRGAARSAGGGSGSKRGPQLTRADLPGSLEHVGDVDEFDAALVRGADGVPMADLPPEDLAEQPPALGAGEEPLGVGEEALGVGEEALGVGEEPISAGNGKGHGITSAPVRAPARPARSDQALPKRAIAFLRASWAELQRVQWPNRAQVTQATAVVLGFVAVAGVYFGVADYVAKTIVEAVL
jgi:preprotein translocase subunit SecE